MSDSGGRAVSALDSSTSAAAGALIEHVLNDEFGQVLSACVDSDLADMGDTYSRPGCAAWVALAGRPSDVVGVAAVTETPQGALELRRLYVDRAWRAQGVAGGLVEAAHKWAERESYQRVVLTTTSLMSDARRLYARHGYVDVAATHQAGATLHRMERTSGARALGTRGPVGPAPEPSDGCLAVVIERPRRLVEGWHWDPDERDLVLAEHYTEPVPVNYGFAPSWTNPADGDNLDVIVLDDRLMSPGETMLCRGAGVLWRPDGDHKLLAAPSDGGERPVPADNALAERIAGWWADDDQPTGWGGPEALPLLFDLCVRLP